MRYSAHAYFEASSLRFASFKACVARFHDFLFLREHVRLSELSCHYLFWARTLFKGAIQLKIQHIYKYQHINTKRYDERNTKNLKSPV